MSDVRSEVKKYFESESIRKMQLFAELKDANLNASN